MRLFGLAGVVLLVLSGLSARQGDDPKQLLLKVRKNVLLTIDRLPKYVCTEKVERTSYRPKQSARRVSCDELATRKRLNDSSRITKYTADRLRLDVAVSGDGEMYSWAGENRFHDKSLANLVHGGATSTGTFAGFLRSIFGGDSASFTFNGSDETPGSRLVEYGFRVPQSKSQYLIASGTANATVAFDGVFSVDPKSAQLVGLNVRADGIPRELRLCEDTTALSYSIVRIRSSEFLLPSEVHWRTINEDGTQLESDTVFSGCREFLGQSSLSFSAERESSEKVHSSAAKALVLPSGLNFTISLDDRIEVKHAAAGDAIKGVVISAIRKGRNQTFIRKGAVVSGRILRLERIYHGGSETLKLALEFDTVEVDGVSQPFYAELDSTVKRRTQTPVPHPGESLRPRQDLGTFGEMVDSSDAGVGVIEFDDVTDDYVIQRGLEISGKTAAPVPVRATTR